MQSTKGISGLAYLEYWTHNGIEERETIDINAVLFDEISDVIKKQIDKHINDERTLGNLNENSLLPNNLMAKAINQ